MYVDDLDFRKADIASPLSRETSVLAVLACALFAGYHLAIDRRLTTRGADDWWGKN